MTYKVERASRLACVVYASLYGISKGARLFPQIWLVKIL